MAYPPNFPHRRLFKPLINVLFVNKTKYPTHQRVILGNMVCHFGQGLCRGNANGNRNAGPFTNGTADLPAVR